MLIEADCPHCGAHFVLTEKKTGNVLPEHRLARQVNVGKGGPPRYTATGPVCQGSGQALDG